MPESNAYTFSQTDFDGTVRLFPLPNLVLFPHVMQPLHLFEPRYCQMLADAMLDDRLIAMAVLQPGWEDDYEGKPQVGPIACLGRIIASQRLEDGTFNILLVGLRRVRLEEEIDPQTPYRQARATICDDVCPAACGADCRELTRRLNEAILHALPFLPNTNEQLESFLSIDLPLGILCDVIGFSLELDTARKEALLGELNIVHRAELLLAYLDEVASVASGALDPVDEFPPRFSAN